MKINPLNVLLDENFTTDKKFYFISGNEVSLMDKIYSSIVEKYSKKEKISVIKIDSIDDFVDEVSLFQNKRIFLIKKNKEINDKNLNKIKSSDADFIFMLENSQKIKGLKNIFLKDNHSYLIDCYELDKDSRIKILNHFINLNKIKINKDIYWMLVEKLDGKYSLFENSLSKILELDQKDININNIKKIITINDSGKDRLFFSLFKKNREIIKIYREKILTGSDVNELYYFCKFYCQLIIDCRSEEEYNKKIPVYLFREKSFLVDIFKKYNFKKKKLLIDLLSSTEKILRKQGGLSIVFGLRFLLSIKKITVS